MLPPNVAIVVYSSCCLPQDLVQELGITVVPHELVIGDRTYQDGIDIQPSEFYQLLLSEQASITTVAPSPQRFAQAFSDAEKIAPKILCLTLSANSSMTHQAALSAAVSDEGAGLTVAETGAAAGSLGLITLAAARSSASGRSLESVLAEVNRLATEVNLVAFLDTLRFLKRSGRIGRLQGWASQGCWAGPATAPKLS